MVACSWNKDICHLSYQLERTRAGGESGITVLDEGEKNDEGREKII